MIVPHLQDSFNLETNSAVNAGITAFRAAMVLVHELEAEGILHQDCNVLSC
jgi:hypothetical protein